MTRSKKKSEAADEPQVRTDASGRELYDHEVDPPEPQAPEEPDDSGEGGEVEPELPAEPPVGVTENWQTPEGQPEAAE